MTLLLRVEEAAIELRVSRSRIFQLIAGGELESVLIHGSRRISRDALIRYVDGLTGTRANAS